MSQEDENIELTIIGTTPQKGWNIDEIKEFFNGRDRLPDKIQLDRCTRINDVPLFIESHLSTIEHQNGNETFEAYLIRLQKLKAWIETNMN